MRRMIMLAAAAALVLTTLGSATAPVRAADSFAMTHRHPGDYSRPYIPRDSVFTSRFNGSTVSTRCSHSFYTGTSCNTVTSYGQQTPSVVEDIEAPEDWDKNCGTSCVDLSRPARRPLARGNDPYECFGAGRYDAMREGRVCPGWDK